MILPYKERGKSYLIEPNGKFIEVKDHNEYVSGYILPKFHLPDSLSLEMIKKYVIRNLDGNKAKIDYVLSWKSLSDVDYTIFSNLTVAQLKALKKFSGYSVDFVVDYLQYDYIKSFYDDDHIITTARNPHERFFNYYLMERDIFTEYRLFYDENSGTFFKRDLTFRSDDDDFYKEEIEKIKKRVPLEDRKRFFK